MSLRNIGLHAVLHSFLGLLVIPAVADDVVIEIPRYEGGVQVSSGSIPNCCSNHSMTSVNASSLAMKGCTTLGGYCMTSRNAPFLTFDLSSIPEDATIESVRLKGTRSSPRSGGGNALVAFLPYGEVGPSMFNVFNGGSTNINWTLSSAFSISLPTDQFNDPDRDRFMVVRLTMGGEYASFIRNTRNVAPILEVTLSTPPCIGDFNDDGMVNSADLGFLVACWGQSNHDADLNDDGMVNATDLGIMLGNWGPCPGP